MRIIAILLTTLWSITEGQIKLLLPQLQYSSLGPLGQFLAYPQAFAEANVQSPNKAIPSNLVPEQPDLQYGQPPHHPQQENVPPRVTEDTQSSNDGIPNNSIPEQPDLQYGQPPHRPQQENVPPRVTEDAQSSNDGIPNNSIPEQPDLQFGQPPLRPQQENVPPRLTEEDLVEAEWQEFKLAYNKVYSASEEERLRREIFIENKVKISRFNQEFAKGLRNFVQRMNAYGDMLVHEFNRKLNGFNRTRRAGKIALSTPTTFIPSANVDFPESVDWRQLGAVSSVKNQQLCAACWAFAAAGALEGHTFRKTGKLEDVSIQNLLDCTRPLGNDGCEGGLIDPAFEYVKQNNGVDGEAAYPYEAKEKNCRLTRDNTAATCTGYVDIAEGDERHLEIAVATLGPVAAAIDASRDSLQFYSDGIYYDPECGNTPDRMNHAVLVVGYGTEPSGQKYWLVKNSYGAQWGIQGYIKIAKDYGNHCGIATQASYPLV